MIFYQLSGETGAATTEKAKDWATVISKFDLQV
jgi:hypothetical protein